MPYEWTQESGRNNSWMFVGTKLLLTSDIVSASSWLEKVIIGNIVSCECCVYHWSSHFGIYITREARYLCEWEWNDNKMMLLSKCYIMEFHILINVVPWLFACSQRMLTHVASFDSLTEVLAYCVQDTKLINLSKLIIN